MQKNLGGKPGLSRRSILRGTLGFAGLAALAACGENSEASDTSAAPTLEPKADGDLTWFTWADYVDPEILADFEKKYGIKVTITSFDSDDTMIQKLAAGLPYDLITTNSAYMFRAIEGKLLAPFSLDVLTNKAEILPYFHNPAYEKGANRYSVPYSGGPTGIVYRTDKVTPAASFNDFWDNPDAAGHIFVLDYVEDTMGMSLLRKGFNLNSAEPDEVTAATDELIALKPRLAGISNDTRNNVGNGTAWIHHSWSTDAYAVMTNSKYADQLAFAQTTKDGVPFGMDLLSVGAKAKAPGSAMLLIDWLLAPENVARNVKYCGQLSGTKTGDATYKEIVKDIPSLQVPDNFYETAQWRESLVGARRQLWTQQWNRFKAS